MNLFQRLLAPRPNAASEGVKPHHVFGGAALELSPKAWSILDSLCTVDYMGATEYEFGTLPRFLGAWAGATPELCGFAFRLDPGDYEAHWMRRAPRNDGRPPLPPLRTRAVYGILRAADADQRPHQIRHAERLFRAVAKGEEPVKGGGRFTAALDPERTRNPPYPLRDDGPRGWIALDLDAMFFVDVAMWRGFATLFGVDVSAVEIPVEPVPDYATWRKPALAAAAVAEGIFGSKTAAMALSRENLIRCLEAE